MEGYKKRFSSPPLKFPKLLISEKRQRYVLVGNLYEFVR